jgi:hypothetical protein
MPQTCYETTATSGNNPTNLAVGLWVKPGTDIVGATIDQFSFWVGSTSSTTVTPEVWSTSGGSLDVKQAEGPPVTITGSTAQHAFPLSSTVTLGNDYVLLIDITGTITSFWYASSTTYGYRYSEGDGEIQSSCPNYCVTTSSGPHGGGVGLPPPPIVVRF